VIAVVDDGAHLLYLQREKDQLGSIDVAINKAKTVSMFRRPTQVWEQTVADGRQGYLALEGTLPIEGGIPLKHNGEIAGVLESVVLCHLRTARSLKQALLLSLMTQKKQDR